MYVITLWQVLIRRRPRAGTKKRRKKKGPSEQEKRQEILAEYMQDESESDSDTSTATRRSKGKNSRKTRKQRQDDSDSDDSSSRRRGSTRKLRKPSLKKIQEEEDEVYDGEETEDYWFFVNRWFDTSEDDKAIERELMPTDEKGNPLHTLEGLLLFLVQLCSKCKFN